SVTKWCLAAELDENDIKRAERCGRLTGDVAAKAVELLNAHYAGTFAAVTPLPSAVASCKFCHWSNGIAEPLTYTNGKEHCDSCHEPHDIDF
ncbi:MAG: hypothetical protein RBU21_21730, partial [FCB group bacterium]|nr:hypothetical protein [FCB group bacterium]